MSTLHLPNPPMPSEWRLRGLAAELVWERAPGQRSTQRPRCTWRQGQSFFLQHLSVGVTPFGGLVPDGWYWVALPAASDPCGRITSADNSPSSQGGPAPAGPAARLWAAYACESYTDSMLAAWQAVHDQRAPRDPDLWSSRLRLMADLVRRPADEREIAQRMFEHWRGSLEAFEPVLDEVLRPQPGARPAGSGTGGDTTS